MSAYGLRSCVLRVYVGLCLWAEEEDVDEVDEHLQGFCSLTCTVYASDGRAEMGRWGASATLRSIDPWVTCGGRPSRKVEMSDDEVINFE